MLAARVTASEGNERKSAFGDIVQARVFFPRPGKNDAIRLPTFDNTFQPGKLVVIRRILVDHQVQIIDGQRRLNPFGQRKEQRPGVVFLLGLRRQHQPDRA